MVPGRCKSSSSAVKCAPCPTRRRAMTSLGPIMFSIAKASRACAASGGITWRAARGSSLSATTSKTKFYALPRRRDDVAVNTPVANSAGASSAMKYRLPPQNGRMARPWADVVVHLRRDEPIPAMKGRPVERPVGQRRAAARTKLQVSSCSRHLQSGESRCERHDGKWRADKHHAATSRR